MTTLKHLVYTLRDKHGVSLRSIAQSVGYDKAYLSRVVNGRKPFSVQLARDLADAYHLTAEDRGKLLAEAVESEDYQFTDEELRLREGL